MPIQLKPNASRLLSFELVCTLFLIRLISLTSHTGLRLVNVRIVDSVTNILLVDEVLNVTPPLNPWVILYENDK